MDTRNCCSGCAGVDNVYSCSNPIRRPSVSPVHTCSIVQPVKNEESVVKKEECGAVEAMAKATVFVKKEDA
ncbi:hypothetical protein SASPL_107750 [Salvia splendens]|uniref:Uncharacterized protein n=1 Tax=Salvia splendens TaxID=180675 RepID=A0A8X8YBV1_SALSN|nr:hypothetical protein SASPL_107750 [Salvia splendens]